MKQCVRSFLILLVVLLGGGSLANAQPIAPSVIDFSGYGVQPGSTVNVSIDVTNQDRSIDTYNYNLTADASGAYSVPQINAEFARSVEGRVNYQIVMTSPQISEAANQTYDFNCNCNVQTANEIPQTMEFEWSRQSRGVRFSGSMTPYGSITTASSNDPNFGAVYDEYDDFNEYYNATAQDFISIGDYFTPAYDHVTSEVSVMQFSAVIQNNNVIVRDDNHIMGSGYTVSPIHQTGFDFNIDTTIPPLPPSQSGNVGNPNAGGGNASAAIIAAGAAYLSSLFGLSQQEVQDAYAGEPLGDMAEQITMSNTKEVEGASTIKTAEQQEKAVTAIQEKTLEAVVDHQPDPLGCEVSSLSSLSYLETLFHRRNTQNALRRGFIGNASGRVGSSGALLPSEQKQARIARFRDTNCSASTSNGGLSELCQGSATTDDNINRDVDAVSCLVGNETVDSDIVNGNADQSCIEAISRVSPANKPIPMPSETVLNQSGAQEMEEKIIEFKPALDQHASIVSDSLSSMHAKMVKSPGGSAVNEFRALLTEIGFDASYIEKYIPTSGGGLSENAQLEVISKYMIANPSFMIRLQSDEASIMRVRALLRGISLRLDGEISEMITMKGQNYAAPTAIMLRDDRKRANSELLNLSTQ